VIRRLLIANRAEIALRIVRACRELGVESIAVYSDADRHSPHVAAADLAFRLGPPPPSESYLNVDRLISVAREARADAVHPGYGFLSERARFAQACEDAGLVFVGPPAAALERMGSKIGARTLMQQAGVPVVRGETPQDQSDEAIRAAIRRVGFPVLLKPAAGGGGIGMKTLRDDEPVDDAIQSARREAVAAFGDGTLYVERLVERPRHVEIQVFADSHGNVVHLFERECSVQRRHQKTIEESPCPALTPELRSRMCAAAVSAARAAHYENAGTVEFLLEGNGATAQFYFLEMNTRLQVEHPLTECVVGVDLVQAQLRVASGETLPWRQEDLRQRGHAIECRVYAEDPAANFMPQAGTLLRYSEPDGPGIRVDAGYAEGLDVPVYYDPMLAKLIVWAETRDAAIARAMAALQQFVVLGIRTNIPFLLTVLQHPRFKSADIDTRFLDAEGDALRGRMQSTEFPLAAIAAAIAHTERRSSPVGRANLEPRTPGTQEPRSSRTLEPFISLSAWRG
jgi:acetyl-CoA carboxylase biotin carboxylase subunit